MNNQSLEGVYYEIVYEANMVYYIKCHGYDRNEEIAVLAIPNNITD